ncbi:uncharacterized protein KY384_001849 [Bacidia gigantensis]|uniref:uncharacterized protein n=1 Tax=Bacidia gigantensis TaxID=2732470 RepID=UPI001D03A119|nr:uncharacterized protein KY384_001849 [Bacidia gigantensis]KAG8533066.1 hypothetical protein KY384_001849 [Bacidia gigantensis]
MSVRPSGQTLPSDKAVAPYPSNRQFDNVEVPHKTSTKPATQGKEMNGDAKGGLKSALSNNIGELFVKRRRPRSSGEPLLQDGHTDGRDHTASTSQDKLSSIAKGKRKTTNGNATSPKARGSSRRQDRHTQSSGSSPLASELRPNQPDEINSPDQPDPHIRIQTTNANNYAANAVQSRDDDQFKARPASRYDTDPTQIVNLALSLGESRRRNFNSGGFLVAAPASSNRRLTSYGQPTLALPDVTTGGSLRQHLLHQRHGGRNISTRSDRSSSTFGRHSPGISQNNVGERKSSFMSNPVLEPGSPSAFDASDATFSRAEKAKESFELMYEYRRLLPYLPNINSDISSKQSYREASESDSVFTDVGRKYNPLQYIRNRKLRLRERRPLTAEADGWKDLSKVRPWVDSAISEREDGISRVDDRYPLPPFDSSHAKLVMTDELQDTNTAQSISRRKQHPGRPYNDWTISPWDLLADTYWVNQDDNITHIEDSAGRKIFEGYGMNDKPSTRLSKDSVRSTNSHASFSNAQQSPESRRMYPLPSKNERREYNKHQLKPSDVSTMTYDRGRKSKWTRGFTRSREPSLSEDSDWEQKTKPKPKDHTERDHLDNIALEKQMMDMLASEEADGVQLPGSQEMSPSSQLGYDTPSLENSPPTEHKTQSSGKRPSLSQRMKTDMPVGRRPSSPRTSFDDQLLRHRRVSSHEFDSTEPNSPTTDSFVPSIAINLSPPTSPSENTTSPKRPSGTNLRSFMRLRRPDSPSNAISDYDFGAELKGPLSGSKSNTAQENQDTDLRKVATTNNYADDRLSPIKSRNKPYLHESRSLRSLKDSNEPESRFRNFLKGGKVVDMVGNQVSRASDILRRKEKGRDHSAPASATRSRTSTESDADDADISALESSTNDISRVTTNNENLGRSSQPSTRAEKPRYFMNNLPSFKSPNKDGDQSPQSPMASPTLDPIQVQQQVHRERSRSSRFDRLAPPKIDMRSVSPSPSQSRGRRQNRPSKTNTSQPSSTSRSRARMTSHGRLNDILGIPGQVGSGGPSSNVITGLARFEAEPQQGTKHRPAIEGKRQWSITDREVTVQYEAVTDQNIARVRALLLSSGVKANEIARKAEEIPDNPPKFLQAIEDVVGVPPQRVPRAQQHVISARLLLSSVEKTNRQLHDAQTRFSDVTFNDLHSQIGDIDKRINASITPLVRSCADDADNFSTELTTTHTLSLKEMNDQVDLTLRRRRQRSRWLRRGGWAMLEWMVLGTMWMVWLIVMIVQLIKGTIRAFLWVLKWLFWL